VAVEAVDQTRQTTVQGVAAAAVEQAEQVLVLEMGQRTLAVVVAVVRKTSIQALAVPA
jgi:hypothetical protein